MANGAKPDEPRGKIRVGSPGGRPGCLATLGWLGLVLVVVLLVAGFFAARSQRGREAVRDRLQRYLGVDVEITATRIGWPYALVIEGLQSAGYAEGQPGFRAHEVRIGLGLRTRWSVYVHRAELTLVNDANSGWQPAFFGRLGDLPVHDVAGISRLTEGLGAALRLDLSEGQIRWINEGGTEVAGASGISFEMEPARVPGWRMLYHSLRAYNILYPDGSRTRDISCEWLSASSRDYIEIEQTPAQDPANGARFWQPAAPRAEGKGLLPDEN